MAAGRDRRLSRTVGRWPGPGTAAGEGRLGATRLSVKQHQRALKISTQGRGFYDVTGEIGAVVFEAGITTGVCTVFIRHTSASLVIQENADPAVLRDLSRWIDELAPDSDRYEHDDEGPDDMASHLRSTVTRTSESIPVTRGRLCLGTWQALYVWEHRLKGNRRELVVHVVGE